MCPSGPLVYLLCVVSLFRLSWPKFRQLFQALMLFGRVFLKVVCLLSSEEDRSSCRSDIVAFQGRTFAVFIIGISWNFCGICS